MSFLFGIRLGECFCQKARLVGGVHVMETPAAFNYSSVVSRDAVCIDLTLVALNRLDLLACNIQNYH